MFALRTSCCMTSVWLASCRIDGANWRRSLRVAPSKQKTFASTRRFLKSIKLMRRGARFRKQIAVRLRDLSRARQRVRLLQTADRLLCAHAGVCARARVSSSASSIRKTTKNAPPSSTASLRMDERAARVLNPTQMVARLRAAALS